LKEWVARFRATHDFDFYGGGIRTILEYLQGSIQKSGTVEPEKIAAAMEGMTRPDMLGNETVMRADDHQIMLPYYVSVFTKDVKYDSEHTGLGWKVVQTYEAKDLVLPTTCNMKRPAM
jgi:branched-chain amino acid transport system substrate-binding protein